MKSWPALDICFSAPGFMDLVQAVLSDFGLAAIDEGAADTAPPVWRVFFHHDSGRNAARAALQTRFPPDVLSIASLDVPDEDWAARSQADLRAVRVGDIVIAPPWDLPDSTDHVTVIVIQPSMGFGTGHHATTRLCLMAMQQLDLRGKTVLDVGTGSGVLAIAASRLGAARVLAVDDDLDAIESARTNVGLNPGVNVTLGTLDIRTAVLKPFDAVVANLTGDVLASVGTSLRRLGASYVIASGLLVSEEDTVLSAFRPMVVLRRAQHDDWVCITFHAEAMPPTSGSIQ